MKLVVALRDSIDSPGGRAFMLIDECGVPLPGQVLSQIETGIGVAPSITITLRVDGEKVRFE